MTPPFLSDRAFRAARAGFVGAIVGAFVFGSTAILLFALIGYPSNAIGFAISAGIMAGALFGILIGLARLSPLRAALLEGTAMAVFYVEQMASQILFRDLQFASTSQAIEHITQWALIIMATSATTGALSSWAIDRMSSYLLSVTRDARSRSGSSPGTQRRYRL